MRESLCRVRWEIGMCYEMLEWNGDAVAFVRPLFAVVHI
jgi:hypothetical protein